MFEFEYSELMKEYRKRENINNEIKEIKKLGNKSSKLPYFEFLLIGEGFPNGIKQKVRTKIIDENSFKVMQGCGQFQNGIFKEN